MSDRAQEITEEHSREMRVAGGEVSQVGSDTLHTRHLRFEYRYDGRGNWTERIVSHRTGSGAEFQRSNVERRTITYYSPE